MFSLDNRDMRHLLPLQTWPLLQSAPAESTPNVAPLFIDVRMEVEMLYVGCPPGIEHVCWYEYPELTPNADAFSARVLQLADGHKERTVILLCRSGQRSVHAGLALELKGFTDVVNLLHGFEGDLDDHGHRSTVNGWRFDGLPWQQI